MNFKSKGEKNIKIKVIAGYTLLVLLSLSIVYFAFRSFQNLTQSADKLARPNARITLLHDIMFTIYQAESHIRSYTLNQQESHLDLYFEELAKTNDLVDSLYYLAKDDPFFTENIDSINSYLSQKTKLLEQFIEVRALDQNSVFYERALDEIIQVADEETRIKEITRQTIIDESPAVAVEQEEEDPDEQKDNFFSRVRNFFSGRSEEQTPSDTDTQQQEILAGDIMQKIKTDSITTVYRDTKEFRQEVELVLQELMRSAIQQQQHLNIRENQILLEDKKTMDQIWNYVAILEEYESQQALLQAQNAHITVKRTTEIIFTIVVTSLVILLLFSWLFINDINKSKYYKKQLIKEKEKAENLVLIKQRFMANMSHEIRTPLNSIIGFSNQISKTSLDKKQEAFSMAINQSSNHLLGIVNDILDFSKIEAGKIELEVIPLDIRELAQEVYNTFSVVAEEKELTLSLDCSGLKMPYVMGDALRIKQILLNIAGNALKFTEKGFVKITISDYPNNGKSAAHQLLIKIADSGPGIPLANQKQIFDEFAQSDSEVTRKHGGTGLGLSISKKLAELMDGRIELYSQPGKGSTFSIYLTLFPGNKPYAVKAEKFADDEIIDISRKKILLIDDDQLNRLLIKSIFENYNIELWQAENAEEAMVYLKENKFNLIISDIQMPGISGIEMVKRIRTHQGGINQNTPVIACTADITSETLKQIKDTGINDYLVKPFDEQLLISKTAKLTALKPDKREPELTPPSQSVKETEDDTGSSKHSLYSLDALKKFTGTSIQSIASVLEIFMKDTQKHLVDMEQCNKNKDYRTIARLAHKMLNMYRMLKITGAVPHLEQLDLLRVKTLPEKAVTEHIKQIKNHSKEVISQLQKDLQILS